MSFPFVFLFWVLPWLSDTYGRRKCIICGDCIMLVGIIIQSATKGYTLFIVSRIIIGAGGAIVSIGNVPLLTEIAYPTHREIATTCYNTLWYSGAIIAAWATYGCYHLGNTSWAWRPLVMMQSAFVMLQLAFMKFVPESPRYLASRGKTNEARAMLMKWHGGDDEARCGEFIDAQLAEITNSIEFDKINNRTGYKTFISSKANIHRLAIVCFLPILLQFSGNSLVSYYLTKVLNSIGITTPSQQLIINGALMTYNQGTAIMAPFFVNRIGRRVMFLSSTIMMFICYLIWTVLSAINEQTNFENKALGKGVLAMIFLYYFAYNSGLCGLPYLYLSEVLPFSLRAKGMNIFLMIQIILGLITGFTNPIALEAIRWKYYILWTCWLLLEIIIIYFLFPETRGYSLEDVQTVFGDNFNSGKLNRQTQNEKDNDEFNNKNIIICN